MSHRWIFAHRAVLVCLGMLLFATSVSAWSPKAHRLIAFEAARLAPPDLFRQLVRNRESFAIGVREPLQKGDPRWREKNADGSGLLDQKIEDSVREAIAAIEGHRPFNEIAYRLGVVAHYLALANHPLAVANHDAAEARFAADFDRYLDSVDGRFRPTFYGFTPRLSSMAALVRATLERSRRAYPLVGREYRRVDFRSGVPAFDDRSTAFALAALAYNHAISDIAETLRYIWLTAGGADSRRRLPIKGRDTLQLAPR